MNVNLISAYFQVTEGETNTKKYATKLAEKWLEIYPDKQFTGKHLIAQVKNIKSRKLLAPEELITLKEQINQSSPTRNITSIRRSILRRSTLQRLEISYQDDNAVTPETEIEEPDLQILELFAELSLKWEGTNMETRPRIPKLRQNKNTKLTIKTINRTLEETMSATESFEELCHKVYVAATVATIILQTTSKEEHPRNQPLRKPPWEERIERKISALRKEIGVLHAYLNNPRPSRKLEKKVLAYARKFKLKK